MFTLNLKGKLLVAESPLVMGIINATPDSFYKGDLSGGQDGIADLAGKMLEEGADMIDIGGQSTRPGSTLLSAKEEMARVLPMIAAILNQHPEIIISVDTFYSEVALAAVSAGAVLVNDVSGGADPEMFAAVASLRVPYVCMHIKGTPQTMQNYANYEDVVSEVMDYFSLKCEQCRLAGVQDVIIDPGFGFAKTATHNLTLLHNLAALKMFDRPLLVGLSRKATIYKTLGITPNEALNGTTVLNTLALNNGADILRVHDVKEAREAISLTNAYKKAASL